MTGAQKCSHVHGMACEVGLGAYVWMRIAARAALEYNLGDCNAIRGDLRGGGATCSLVGSSVGGGSVVGAAMGMVVCGVLFRVSR